MHKLMKKMNVAAVAALFISSPLYASTTYTTDADFALGTLNGVNYDAPNANQLQINVTGTTFPILWVANYGDATFSKVNTDGVGCEEARYLTWFADPRTGSIPFTTGPAPSRTAVNVDGDVYLANRHFDGGTPDLIKFAAEGGIDRNGNGVIDTSTDLNGDCQITLDEMLPVIDGANIGGPGIPGVLDVTDFYDERVIWVRQYGTPGSLGRSVCLDVDGNVWAGTYQTNQYYKFDENGALLAGPINSNARNYGCAVDSSGTLWGATLGSTLVKMDTNTNTWVANFTGSFNYGITLGNGKVYLGSTLRSFDPTTSTFGPTIASGGTGVAVDGDGAVWFGTPTLRKFEVDPNTGFLNPTPVCSVGTPGVRGPIVDKDGDVWSIDLSANTVTQYDSNCNFISTVPVGRSPYTYSDATGFGQRNNTDPSGIWTVVNDSGSAGTGWENISWNMEPEGSVPAGSSIEVEARASDSTVDLATTAYSPVTNNAGALGLTGQYIQIRAVLRPTDAGVSPVLSDLTVDPAQSFNCDADGDDDVDRFDIAIISQNRNTPIPPGDPLMDLNGDGVISRLDARLCTFECTNASCAP